MATLPEYYTGNVPTAQIPGIDPRYQQSVLQGQKNLATQFRSNLPKYQDELGNQFEKSAKQQLAENTKGIKKDFNSRGLLRSGGRMGAEAKAAAQTGYDVAKGRYDINQTLADQADTLENNYINSAYGIAGVNPQIGGGLLQNAQNSLNNQIASNQAMQDIYSGAGKGLVSIFSKYTDSK